ncbi:hypothetical protein PIB30_021069 [Stylosanthes scabra]|uniref:Transposase n=1 Tax=Stylosanthes scabra TaxID=79078 RepID=A0ABU6XAC2_9FABA|nr:hypothetical protein [Stylosanthes scabra]
MRAPLGTVVWVGDRGKGTGGRRGRPRKRTGIPLDLEDAEAGSSTPPVTSTPVIPTLALSEGMPAMRMILAPGSRVQSSETTRTPLQRPTPAQTLQGARSRPVLRQSQCQGPRLTIHCLRERKRISSWRRSELDRLVESTSVGTAFSMASDHAIHFWWDRWRAFFRLQRGYEFAIYESWRMRAAKTLREMMHEIHNKGAPHGWIREDPWDRLLEFWRQKDFKKLKQTNKRNQASETGGSRHTGGSTTYEATRERMVLELGRTPTQSEVFATTHTRKEDLLWVDRWSEDFNVTTFLAELKRMQTERRVIIDTGGPEPPPIDEDAVWARIAASYKRGRIYGNGVVPSHKYPAFFADLDDDDTAIGRPDLRERVTLLTRELTQQAEAHAQRVTTVVAVYSEKVRSLESTMQAQSKEVSEPLGIPSKPSVTHLLRLTLSEPESLLYIAYRKTPKMGVLHGERERERERERDRD